MLMFKDLRYSVRALVAAKGRTILTMLGVIIGVMSVIAVASVGLSAQELIVGQVETFGSNLVAIIPGGSDEDHGPPPLAFGIVLTTLTREDARELGKVKHVEAYSAYTRVTETVSFENETMSTTVLGTGHQLPDVENMTVDSGRYFSERDEAGFGRVAVLGSEVKEKLFPRTDPIGKMIRIKGLMFQVIGTVEERGSAFFQNQDDQVMIPVTTAQRLIMGIDHLTFIRMKVNAEENIGSVKEDAVRLLLRRHGIRGGRAPDFTIRSTDVALDVLGSVTGAIKGFLLAVTAISLLVGGINIMNIMFVAVRERTREIGLRKALGAKQGRIMAQFLIESVIISLTGGAIGIVMGIILSWAIAFGVTYVGYDWEFVMPISGIWQATGVAASVGIIFGVYPAWKAAKLDAIEALRYE